MSTVGQKIDGFGQPMCNSFQAKLFNDRLCYEVDLNKFSNNNNIRNELKLGFVFFLDYNEDRQVTFDRGNEKVSIVSSQFVNTTTTTEAHIYLNTIGNLSLEMLNNTINKYYFFRACNVSWGRPIQSQCNERNQSYRIIPRT